MQLVNLRLDRFGSEALDEHLRGTGASEAAALDVAVRYYLADSSSGRLAWRVPKDGGPSEAAAEMELEVDDEVHAAMRRESERQGVPPDLLAMHALMYYLVDLDSGRAAARLGDAINRDAEA